MEEILKNSLEKQKDYIEKNGDTIEAIYEALFRVIGDLTNEDAVALKKYRAIAKQGKALNKLGGDTNILTDGKRIAILKQEFIKWNFCARDLGIIVSEVGEITDLGLEYSGYNQSSELPNRPPFNEIKDNATSRAKKIYDEEKANIIKKIVIRIRDFIKNRNTTMIDDGEMTEYDIKEVFANLRTQSAQLEWKRKNEVEQKRLERIEEFKESIRINGKDSSNLDEIDRQEER